MELKELKLQINQIPQHERFWAEFSSRYTKSDHQLMVMPNFRQWGASDERKNHNQYLVSYEIYKNNQMQHHTDVDAFFEKLIDCTVPSTAATINAQKIKEYLAMIHAADQPKYDRLVDCMKQIIATKKLEDSAWKNHLSYRERLLHATKEIVLDNGYKCYLFDKRYMDHRRELINLILTLIALIVGIACSLLSSWDYNRASLLLAGASFIVALVGLIVCYIVKEQLDDISDISCIVQLLAYYLGYMPRYVYTNNPKNPEEVYN